VFFPQYVKKQTIRRKPVCAVVPLFPSYLFVQFDVHGDQWKCLQSTIEVDQLLTARQTGVTPLPIGFVEQLMQKADNDGVMILEEADEVFAHYNKGDILKITNGVFEGMNCEFERIKSGKGIVRIVVLLSLLSGKTRVSLDSSDVARVA
jgi:transcriptional antiterminator RfaH